MTELELWRSLAGGGMIGLAAVLFMLLNGRIAGVSGVVAGVLAPFRGEGWADLGWRLAFVAGLFLAPFVAGLIAGSPVAVTLPHPLWAMIAGGVLVGYGARLGSGCTSGHGVCGVARLSKRSFAATGVFMATAIVTVFVLHRLPGV